MSRLAPPPLTPVMFFTVNNENRVRIGELRCSHRRSASAVCVLHARNCYSYDLSTTNLALFACSSVEYVRLDGRRGRPDTRFFKSSIVH